MKDYNIEDIEPGDTVILRRVDEDNWNSLMESYIGIPVEVLEITKGYVKIKEGPQWYWSPYRVETIVNKDKNHIMFQESVT